MKEVGKRPKALARVPARYSRFPLVMHRTLYLPRVLP
jgi:hypothetical protein